MGRPYSLDLRERVARFVVAGGTCREAIRAELAERGVVVSYDAVWRFYRRQGVTFKKKACTPSSRIGRT